MKRLVPALATVLLALGTRSLGAAEPDLRTPEIRALRSEYEASRAALAAKRLSELRTLLERHLEEQRRKQRQAKLSGNTTHQADAAQAVRLFEQALETLGRDDTFAFPAKVRPALERMTAFCTRALASENAARESGYKLLDTRFAGRLQPIRSNWPASGRRCSRIPARFRLRGAASRRRRRRRRAGPPRRRMPPAHLSGV